MNEGFSTSAELRYLFESRLGRSVSDDHWDQLLASQYQDLEKEEILEQDPKAVVGRLLALTTLGRKTSSTVNVAPPASWGKFFRTKVMPLYRDDQLLCLGRFDRREFLEPDDLADFLTAAARDELERIGERLGEQVLPAPPSNVRLPSSDWVGGKSLRHLPAAHFDVFEYQGGVPSGRWRRVSFRLAQNSPLTFLKEIVGAIASQYPETSEAHIVSYLLADVPFVPVWLKATGSVHGFLHIFVGSPEVKPEEVASAYATARRDLLRLYDEKPHAFEGSWTTWGNAGWLTRKYKRSADSHSELIEYMQSKIHGGVSKREAAWAWKRDHPEDVRAVDSLTRTYQRYGLHKRSEARS